MIMMFNCVIQNLLYGLFATCILQVLVPAPHYQVKGELFAVINGSEPGDCIMEGDTLILICRIKDVEGTGATVWTGSDPIFNCPNENSIANRRVHLFHQAFQNPAIPDSRVFCTDNVVGQIVEYNGTHYTSRLTVSTTQQINAGVISCHSYYETEITGQVQISVGGEFNFSTILIQWHKQWGVYKK